MTDESPAIEFKARAPHYDKYTRWLDDPDLTAAIERATEGLGYGGICLDLCGGTGRLAIHDTATMKRRWVVVDRSEPMLKVPSPEDAAAIRRCAGEAEWLPFRSDAVQLVAIRSALDYLHIERALAEVRRVLGDEGHLVVVQRTSDLFEGHLSWHRRLQRLRSPNKLVPMSSADVLRTLEDTGFRILSNQAVETQSVYPFDEWVERGGTIPRHRADQIRAVVGNLPPCLAEETGFYADGVSVRAPASWLVVTAGLREPARRLIPLVGAAVVVGRGSSGEPTVLLQRRRTEPEYWQWWELPQGHARSGESVEDAALRELREETGLIGHVTDRHRPALRMADGRRALDAALLDSTQDGRSEYVAVGVEIEAVGGALHEGTAQDFTWFTRRQLEDLLRTDTGVFPLDVPILRSWLRQQERVSAGG